MDELDARTSGQNFSDFQNKFLRVLSLKTPRPLGWHQYVSSSSDFISRRNFSLIVCTIVFICIFIQVAATLAIPDPMG